MAQALIVVLWRRLPLWRSSRDPQLMKGRWSVNGGIDYFKGDADVNVSAVAQNFLMVKMAGRSSGRKKTTVWLSPCSLSPGGEKRFWCVISRQKSPKCALWVFFGGNQMDGLSVVVGPEKGRVQGVGSWSWTRPETRRTRRVSRLDLLHRIVRILILLKWDF